MLSPAKACPGHRWLPGWRRPLPAGLTAPPPLPPAGMKEGGQALLGGLDCMVQRNFFGAQVGDACAGWAAHRPFSMLRPRTPLVLGAQPCCVREQYGNASVQGSTNRCHH